MIVYLSLNDNACYKVRKKLVILKLMIEINNNNNNNK
jgi:hypothetical protein